jgi:hypothetical protein
VFFALMIVGLSAGLPHAMSAGLQQQGVAPAVADQVAGLPPVSTLFAAELGINPLQHLLEPTGALASLPAVNQQIITGRESFRTLSPHPSTTDSPWSSPCTRLGRSGRLRITAARQPIPAACRLAAQLL